MASGQSLPDEDRLFRLNIRKSDLDELIQSIKSGRVEFTRRAPLLVALEDARDTGMYGRPLVSRDPYVGGPTAYVFGR